MVRLLTRAPGKHRVAVRGRSGGVSGMNREEYYLPVVLAADPKKRESAMSTLRALKHAKQVIEDLLPEGTVPHDAQTALDDLDIMISRAHW